MSNIQKHLSDHNLNYIVGGIGFDETLLTDNIYDSTNSKAVIIRFFINKKGNIIYSNNDIINDIIFINYILSKTYVINQIKKLIELSWIWEYFYRK